MATLLARRLPGIRVDVAPPPAVEALPRMDVAVFVGFASTGPLHLPVAIESVGQYAAVFGRDAPLAWDDQRGERIWAHLGCAVRAFFANGGRRCWVLRVARSAALELARGDGFAANDVATSNRFAVPGVLALNGNGDLSAALSGTRCEGAWSDPLRLSSALASRGFAVQAWAALGAVSPPGVYAYSLRTGFALRAGDLVQLGRTEQVCAYAVVDRVRVSTEAAGPYHAELHIAAAFERLRGDTSPSQFSGIASVAGHAEAVNATWLGADPADAAHTSEPAQRLSFDEPVPATLASGHWVSFRDGGGFNAWLRIEQIERSPAFVGSPAAMSTALAHVVVSGAAWRELGTALPASLNPPTQAARLDLALQVAQGGEGAHADNGDRAVPTNGAGALPLAGVGLTPEHRASFWSLQRDEDFYRVPDDKPAAVPADLLRFPLAPEIGFAPLAWLPLGVQAAFGAALAPMPQSATALERDGLAGFDSTLFIDPELAADGVDALITHADDIRLVRSMPRALFGLHAALSVGAGGLFNEASLLAVPDAIHLGWQRRADAEPAPSQPAAGDAPEHWGSHRGPCASQTPAPPDGPDFGSFIDCATRTLQAPLLSGPDTPVPSGSYRLVWSDSEPGATYVLIEATAADFADAREVFRGLPTEHVVFAPREGVYRYQAFAVVGDDISLGSNAVTVVVRHDEWVQALPADAELDREADWLAIHRAALRMASASGDLVVALSMPRHFRSAQALRYAARLRTVQGALGVLDPLAFAFNEARALSHGALYFPWVQSDLRASAPEAGVLPRTPRVVPPDGAATGVLAARAVQRGAWVAAANEPMKDVVALAPPVAAADRQALQDAQINLLRADPRGFFTLSADTLSRDIELRPLNVRRLLIVLRRLALRRGVSYVFEPHGPALRRAVQRSFNNVLSDLFQRGAFAGATPSQSFRIVTDDTLNTPQHTDAGRFFVELQVAPSLPMRFIAVRLAQSGERLSVVEEL